MTVYVIQDQQSVRDGRLQSRFNFEPAKEFGELRFLLGPTAKPFTPAPILEQLEEGLKDFTEDDYVLLVGNPNFMLWIGMILADKVDKVKTLQWARGSYTEIEAQVYDCEPD